MVLLAPGPIVAQLLLMKFGPVENQSERPTRQFSLEEFQRLDRDFRFMLAVDRVEVWRRMIVRVHSDHDSEEDAERWRGRRRSGSTLRNRPQGRLPEVVWGRQLRRMIPAEVAGHCLSVMRNRYPTGMRLAGHKNTMACPTGIVQNNSSLLKT